MRGNSKSLLEALTEVAAGKAGGFGHILDPERLGVARIGEVPRPEELP